MIFHSAELRWFSKKKALLWDMFVQAVPTGTGIEEPVRTDFYLKSPSVSTGVKVRQGNHELKVRSAIIENKLGKIECWTKWSYPEERTLLEKIPSKMLKDWTKVTKKRWIKKYELLPDGELTPITTRRVQEGCGIEFTELEFAKSAEKWYTIGLEAFSAEGIEAENLIFTIRELGLNLYKLEKHIQAGYPEFLARFIFN